jgi:hypothetical protein
VDNLGTLYHGPAYETRRTQMKVVRVTLTAIRKGGKLLLLDSSGERVASIAVDRAERCGKGKAEWSEWARRQITLANKREAVASRVSDPWERKIGNWLVSVRLRKRDRLRQRKPRHSLRSTTEWNDAIKRMYFEHKNASRRANEWQTWADQTAKNTNRRFESISIRNRAKDTARTT